MRPKSLVNAIHGYYRGGEGVWGLTDLGFYRYFRTVKARGAWLRKHPSGECAVPF